jgi:hypothetical protein
LEALGRFWEKSRLDQPLWLIKKIFSFAHQGKMPARNGIAVIAHTAERGAIQLAATFISD